MTLVTNIKKQVIDNDDKKLKSIFREVFSEKEQEDIRVFGTAERDWHDSDLEDIQELLYKHGVICSLTELENHLNSYK